MSITKEEYALFFVPKKNNNRSIIPLKFIFTLICKSTIIIILYLK